MASKTAFVQRAKRWLLAAAAVLALGVLVNHCVENDPTNLAFQTFIRSQPQVIEQVGVITSITLLKQLTAQAGSSGSLGYRKNLYTVVGTRGQATVEVKQVEGGHPIEITEVELSKAPFNTALTYMGLLVLTGGVAGMIWGDRVIARRRQGVWRFFELPTGWSRYLKWPLGLGLVLMGLITTLLGMNGWGS